MAASILSLHAANPEQSGSSAGLLTLTAPTASTSTTGWTVSNTVTNRHSRQTFRTEKATTTFSAITQPNGPPLGKAMDCWRISAVTTGTFSAGTWYSSLSVMAVTGGGAADGKAHFRIWATPSSHGSSTFSELVTDDFNRANENPLATNWTSGPGPTADLQLINNAIRGVTAGLDGYAYYDAIAWPANQVSECRVAAGGSSGGGGPAVRIAAAAETSYFAQVQPGGGSILLWRTVAGTYATIQTISTTVLSTDSVALEAIGSTLRVYKNRIQVGTDTVDTNIASGNAGLAIFDNESTLTLDNWAGGVPTLREISSGIMEGTTVTNVSTTVAQSSSASTQVASIEMNDDYLFLQVAWQRTGAGSATNNDILARIGPLGRSSGNLIGSGIETPTFTVDDGGGAAAPAGGGYTYRRRRDPMAGAS